MSEVEEKLLQLKGYGYQIWAYAVGHSVLIFHGSTSDENPKRIRLEFDNVHYFQFPKGWLGDFYIASDEEWHEIMALAGLTVGSKIPTSIIKRNYQLYKADSQRGTIFVLGHLAHIEYDAKPFPN